MSQFRAGQHVQFAKGVFLWKGMFVAAHTPKQVYKVKEGTPATYDVVFLDAEGQPHVIENVAEAELVLQTTG